MNFQDKYATILKKYFENPQEKYLLEAAKLGNELVQEKVSLDKIAEFHSEAIDRLSDSVDDHALIDANQRVFTLMKELMLAYGGLIGEEIKRRKKTTEELKHSEEMLRGVMTSAQDAVMVIDNEAKVTHWNNAAIHLFGYEHEEVIGEYLHELIVPERFREAHYTGFKQFRNTGEGSVIGQTVELAAVHKDGSEIPVELSLSGMKYQGQWHAIGIVRDISEKLKSAEELKKHRLHLEQLVEERTLELTDARDKAEAANRAKSAFLANMSHEIRTPMNAIIGFTHLLQQSSPTEEQESRLNKIDSSSDHLLSIINDILDLSKIEAGKMTMERTDFRLGTIFDHVESLFTERLKAKGLTLETDIGEASQWFRGDPTRLRQSLLNYVNNAIEFTKQGKISIRTKILGKEGENTLIRFEVQDTGIGIEPDTLSELFSAFTQADVSTTREHGGTGLGLTITRRLAQLMGGEAGAESKLGIGSTFWFTANLGQGDSNELSETSPKTKLSSDQVGSHVLLVEDNAINREVAVALLNSGGLNTDTANNGLMALAMVHDTDYDLVLMDVQMPEMDGLEATRIIRATPGMEDFPVLAMTANVFAEDRQACLKAGMNDFIAKPVDVNNLFSILAKWLPRRDVSETETKLEIASQSDKPPLEVPVPGKQVESIEEQVELTYKPGDENEIDQKALEAVFGADREARLGILKKFITQTGHTLRQIAAGCEKQDAEHVAFHAHKLKSSARTVGANSLSNLCFDLEVAGRKGDWDKIDQLSPQMRPCLERIVKSINEM